MEPFYHALKVASTACIGCISDNLPDGLTSPQSISAVARPPSIPPCHAISTDWISSQSLNHFVSTIPPTFITTITCGNAFFTFSTMAFSAFVRQKSPFSKIFADSSEFLFSSPSRTYPSCAASHFLSHPSPEKRQIVITAVSVYSRASFRSSSGSSGSTVIPGTAPSAYCF